MRATHIEIGQIDRAVIRLSVELSEAATTDSTSMALADRAETITIRLGAAIYGRSLTLLHRRSSVGAGQATERRTTAAGASSAVSAGQRAPSASICECLPLPPVMAYFSPAPSVQC
jgi:hypothetical protein